MREIKKPYFISDINILGGKPVIRGTRMSVHLLMSILMDKNVTIDDVKEMYPNVPIEVIKYIKEKLEKEGKLIIEVEICPPMTKKEE